MKRIIIVAICIIISAGLLMTGCCENSQPKALTLTDITGCDLENCTEVFATYITPNLKRTFTDKADIDAIIKTFNQSYTEIEPNDNLVGIGDFEFRFKNSDSKEIKIIVYGNNIVCNNKLYTSLTEINKASLEQLKWYNVTDTSEKSFEDIIDQTTPNDVAEIIITDFTGTADDVILTDKDDIQSFFDNMQKTLYKPKEAVTKLSVRYRVNLKRTDNVEIPFDILESEIKILNTGKEYVFDKESQIINYFEKLTQSK